jgi:1,4-alpha-glucan branching enzyme
VVVQHVDGSTEFRFFRPDARMVSLAGDFNGWQKTCLPMKPDGDGWWRYRLRLAPGAYQFKYFSDGEWFLDYAAFGLERGPFGWNSVVLVEKKVPKTQAA